MNSSRPKEVWLSLAKSTKCLVLNPSNPESPSFALVTLSDGSHFSYICEKLVNELHCEVGPLQTAEMKCFGQTNSTLMTYRETEVMCKTRDSTPLKLRLRVIPEVVMPVPYVLYTSLNPNKLSDPTPNMVQVNQPDILIGNDHYYKFHPCTTQTFPSGISLIDSDLGPLIGGAGFCPIPQPTVHPVIPFAPSPSPDEEDGPSTSSKRIRPRKIHLRFPCHLCSNPSHNAIRCPADGDTRRMLVAVKDWCFLCLKKHGPNSCLRRSLCEICDGYHNEALCPLVIPPKAN